MKRSLNILCVLCALAAIICLSATTVFATEEASAVEIPEVNIQVGELIPGQALPTPTVPENAGYVVDSWQWYQKVPRKRHHIVLSDIKATTCQDHNIYTLEVRLRTAEGYAFVTKTAKINGEKPNVQGIVSGNVYTIKHTWSMKELIHRIDLVYDIPEAGTAIEDFYLLPVDKNKVKLERITIHTIPSTKTIKSDVQYRYSYAVYPTDAYAFSEDLIVYANGIPVARGGASWDVQSFYVILNYDFKIPTVEFPALPESVEPGSAGGTAELGKNSLYTEPYYNMHSAWIDMRTGEIVETLEAGDVYTLMYMATADPSCHFSDNVAVTVDGVPMEFTQEGELIVLYKTYDLGAKKLDKVEITLPQLYKGSKPGAATVPEGANYWVEEILLAESTTGSFQDAVPVAGANYGTHVYAIPVVVAAEGYIFGEDVELFFNGQKVTAEYQMTDGPYLEIAGYYGTLTAPTTNGWHREHNTWVFYRNGERVKKTWMKDSTGWVYLDENGLMVQNGFAKDSHGTCYLGADGYMVKNRWVKHDGGWYFVNASGYLVTNRWLRDSRDWCYVGADGKMYTSAWIRDSVGWCYVGEDGYMVRNGWAADSQGICRLGPDGYMLKNQWVHDGEGWAYLDKRGYAVAEGWMKDSKDWCYISGYYMVSDVWVKDSKGICRIGSSGYMLRNQWVHDGNGWAYVDQNGYAVFDQFVKDSQGTCYIGSGGYMVKGQHIYKDGYHYYIGSDGYLQWQKPY